jgi:dephospho-CoA kinase
VSDSTPPRALALVGMPGSGKSLCAAHLETQGFFQFRFGGIVVDEVYRRGWPLTPENERIVREEFRAQDGMAAIALRALPTLRAALDERPSIIIDGLYSWSEYKLLDDALPGNLAVVAVVAERGLRYARLAARAVRPLTADEARRRDWQEIEALEKGGPIAIADYTLLNNGGPEDLLAGLDAIIARLGLRPVQTE